VRSTVKDLQYSAKPLKTEIRLILAVIICYLIITITLLKQHTYKIIHYYPEIQI
jgi:hypothetical protein